MPLCPTSSLVTFKKINVHMGVTNGDMVQMAEQGWSVRQPFKRFSIHPTFPYSLACLCIELRRRVYVKIWAGDLNCKTEWSLLRSASFGRMPFGRQTLWQDNAWSTELWFNWLVLQLVTYNLYNMTCKIKFLTRKLQFFSCKWQF